LTPAFATARALRNRHSPISHVAFSAFTEERGPLLDPLAAAGGFPSSLSVATLCPSVCLERFDKSALLLVSRTAQVAVKNVVVGHAKLTTCMAQIGAVAPRGLTAPDGAL